MRASVFFDFLIFICYLILILIGLYLLFYSPLHILINTIAFSIIIILALLLTYSAFIEPRIIQIKNKQIKLKNKNLEEPFKICLISDLGIGTFLQKDFLKRIVDMINNLEYDFLVICGDLIDGEFESIKKLNYLSKINCPNKIFIAGNHDYDYPPFIKHINGYKKVSNQKLFNELAQKMQKLGYDCLVNESKKYYFGNNTVVFSGINDFDNEPEAHKKMKIWDRNKDEIRILLSHNASNLIYRDFIKKFDLMLSGHTHGGQLRLPIIGPVLPQTGYKINRRKYSKGLIESKSSIPVFISSGLGESHLRMRFMNLPEIVVLEVG